MRLLTWSEMIVGFVPMLFWHMPKYLFMLYFSMARRALDEFSYRK